MSRKVFMFHKDCHKGQSFLDSMVDQLQDEGWVDTPAKLDLPKEEPTTGVTAEQAQEADPQVIVNLVKSLGFKVLTQLELDAEINKAKSVLPKFDISSVSNEDLIAEAERRGLKESPDVHAGALDEPLSESIELLQEQFNENPKSLTKEEHVLLGNEKFKLGLRENMKEDTLIAKIKAAMDV